MPYLPLFRRDCDILLALDASADSQDLWFSRAAEYAEKRSLHLWPRINAAALFPEATTASGSAALKVDQAKAQEQSAASHPPHRKQEVNPQPPPIGSGPHSAEWKDGEKQGEQQETKPMPESGEKEPPLGKCK